jgi:hypothetical protein
LFCIWDMALLQEMKWGSSIINHSLEQVKK